MLEIDINFLKHLYLIIEELLKIVDGKNKISPEERQEYINIISKTQRQLKYILRQAEEQYALELIRKKYEGKEVKEFIA
jgi:hypothetical protein